ncbi:hypothetical protein [Deefgea salmonis]|uniref:Sel1 repeat family protein n=1 Tax=Deefgea salmonis TaxID=2875502 RepID=A0ABS8BJ21_9NEIS|nr:hypothetical protein [Deefgea salmonis]MCB5195720.1 hypothetical protein [Deefgea salmonis]
MRFVFLFAVIALTLTGCASNSGRFGINSFNAGNAVTDPDEKLQFYTKAFEEAKTAEVKGMAANNIGAVYISKMKLEKRRSSEQYKLKWEGIKWYALAARYGNKMAIQNLEGAGEKIPEPDLANYKENSQDSQVSNDVITLLLQVAGGLAQGYANANTNSYDSSSGAFNPELSTGKLNISRKDDNFYEVTNTSNTIKTKFCFEYVYYEDVTYVKNLSKLFFKNGKSCDVDAIY